MGCISDCGFVIDAYVMIAEKQIMHAWASSFPDSQAAICISGFRKLYVNCCELTKRKFLKLLYEVGLEASGVGKRCARIERCWAFSV